MNGKIQLSCILEVVTGMHIGANNAFSAIGAVDSPVVTDPRSGLPILPGSSLKGKLRTLLVRSYYAANHQERIGEPRNDPPEIQRLFGAMTNRQGNNMIPAIRSRLQFADCFVCNSEVFETIGLTEVKVENSINRATGVANPRQIERVVSGVQFNCSIIYDLEKEDEVQSDLKLLAKGFRLLQMDYIGGHGTRGSGRISLKYLEINAYTQPDMTKEYIEILKGIFKEAIAYELLSV